MSNQNNPSENNLMTLVFGTPRLTTNGIKDWEQAAFQANTEADGVRVHQILSNMDVGLLFCLVLQLTLTGQIKIWILFCWLE